MAVVSQRDQLRQLIRQYGSGSASFRPSHSLPYPSPRPSSASNSVGPVVFIESLVERSPFTGLEALSMSFG